MNKINHQQEKVPQLDLYKSDIYLKKNEERKRKINSILISKTRIFFEKEEIKNNDELVNNLSKLPDDVKKYDQMNSYLSSNNDEITLSTLSYISETICELKNYNSFKLAMVDHKIIDKIISIFLLTKNSQIFFQCSTILANFCCDFIFFSIKFLDQNIVKQTYINLQNKYYNDPFVLSNCLSIFSIGLENYKKEIEEGANNAKIKNITFETKRILSDMANWISFEKNIFNILPQAAIQTLFKLIEILLQVNSCPNDYEIKCYQNNAHDFFENIILYPMKLKNKDIEYKTLLNFSMLLLELSKNSSFHDEITQFFVFENLNINLFDVILKIFKYALLDNNSSNEDRENNPTLEPIIISYFFNAISNLIEKAILHEKIFNLMIIFFYNYRANIRRAEFVPKSIMRFIKQLPKFSKNNINIYYIIYEDKRNLINNCLKFYVRTNECYIEVMEFLVNIFEVENFCNLKSTSLDDIIKCFANGLDSNDINVINYAGYYMKRLVEIKNYKKYNIDLLLKYEENHVLEKLNKLILNNNNKNLNNDVYELLNTLETIIKSEETKN